MKLRIGVLINELKDLSNWELRIFSELFGQSEIEPYLICSNASSVVQQTAVSKLNSPIFSSFNFRISKSILRAQCLIEEKVFFKKPQSVDRDNILGMLRHMPTLKLNFPYTNGLELLSPVDIQKIRDIHLDVVINLGDNVFGSAIVNEVKHGVWEMLFTDSKYKHQGPIGFWEVLRKHEGIGFALARTGSNTREVHIIDAAYFNRGWSMTETATIVQEGAVSVLVKAIKNLQNNTSSLHKESIVITEYQNPGVLHAIRYIMGFYSTVLQKIIEKLGNSIFGLRPERWSLFLGTGVFMDTELIAPKPLDMPKNEFWADPFLFHYKGEDYVFFENYSYLTKRGKISCGMVNGDILVAVTDVLDLDYHLSFPYIFEEDGDVFLMPETSENKRLEVYRAIDFPTKWELYATAFEGERVADAFFYTDEKNQKWLFLNKQMAESSPMNSELYIYRADSLKMENLEPHVKNPVLIDARVARNGGAIFSHNNERYRPSQRNIDGIYGRALNLNKIEKLTIDEYEEKTIQVITPSFDKKLMGMHHLHQKGNRYVFDAAYKRK